MNNDYFVEMTKEEDELYHHGILGQKWGIRRYQNPDGTLTAAGRKRLAKNEYEISKINAEQKYLKKKNSSSSDRTIEKAKLLRDQELADAYSKYRKDSYLIKKEASNARKLKALESEAKKNAKNEKKALEKEAEELKKEQRKEFLKATLLTVGPVAIAKYMDMKISEQQNELMRSIRDREILSSFGNKISNLLSKNKSDSSKSSDKKADDKKTDSSESSDKKANGKKADSSGSSDKKANRKEKTKTVSYNKRVKVVKKNNLPSILTSKETKTAEKAKNSLEETKTAEKAKKFLEEMTSYRSPNSIYSMKIDSIMNGRSSASTYKINPSSTKSFLAKENSEARASAIDNLISSYKSTSMASIYQFGGIGL